MGEIYFSSKSRRRTVDEKTRSQIKDLYIKRHYNYSFRKDRGIGSSIVGTLLLRSWSRCHPWTLRDWQIPFAWNDSDSQKQLSLLKLDHPPRGSVITRNFMGPKISTNKFVLEIQWTIVYLRTVRTVLLFPSLFFLDLLSNVTLLSCFIKTYDKRTFTVHEGVWRAC